MSVAEKEKPLIDKIEITIEEKMIVKNVVEKGVIDYNKKHVTYYEPISFHLLAQGPDQDILGGITGERVCHHLKVDWVWILDDFRKAGLGRKLFCSLERYGHRHGVKDIQLETAHFQARGFYEKLGFRLVATLPSWLGTYDCYIMRKKIY